MLPTITITGNMKRIELKYTQSGKAMCKFQIECAEKGKNGEWTNLYLSGETWEKQAEFVNQYFRDGSVAIVTGKLYTNVYEKQDGTKVYENKLLFPKVDFAPKDKSEGSQQPQQQQNNANTQPPSYQKPQMQVARENIPAIDIDDVPF